MTGRRISYASAPPYTLHNIPGGDKQFNFKSWLARRAAEGRPTTAASAAIIRWKAKKTTI